jgi:dihydrofolate synthase/folylpolyglutamate synthase
MTGIDTLLRIPKFSSEIGLDRCKDILFQNRLNRAKFPWIHIAGTKGKGSTSVFIANILEASGYKTGLFLSPHLQSITERISVNLRTISLSKMDELYWETNELIPKKYGGKLNFFEMITIMSFLYFSQQKVDVAVIETGLGGRLDATSAVENPILTIITALGYDHTERLGSSIESITYEKAGIFKTGVPVVSANQPISSLEILEQESSLMHTKLYTLQHTEIITESPGDGFFPDIFSIGSNVSNQNYQHLQTHLVGNHQILNASLALTSMEVIQTTLPNITKESIAIGLKKAYIPGRFEQMKDPMYPDLTIIADGAHNPQSAKSLSETIQKRFPNRKIHFLVSILQNKLLPEIISGFLSTNTSFQFTSLPNHDTYKEQDYKKIWGEMNLKVDFTYHENFVFAYQRLVKIAHKEDVLCITGSLYFVGLIREYLNYLPCSIYEQNWRLL